MQPPHGASPTPQPASQPASLTDQPAVARCLWWVVQELVDRLGDVAVELHGALQAHAMGRYCRPFLHQLKANPNFNLSEYHKASHTDRRTERASHR